MKRMKLGFRAKTMIWVWMMVALLMLATLMAMIINSINMTMSNKRAALKRVAKLILRQQDKDPTLQTWADLDRHLMFLHGPNEFGYALVDNNGNLIHRSEGFQGDWKKRFHDRRYSKLYLIDITSKDGFSGTWSQWHFLYRLRGEKCTVFLYDVGRYELLERMLQGLFICLIVTVFVALPVAVFFSRRVLDPVNRIAVAARNIRDGNFGARIDTITTNDELSRLIDNLNTTFKILEEAISARSRFSSDVAHELRTPLACLVGSIEITLNRERSIGEYRQALTSCLDDAKALSSIVEQLLIMSKPASRQACNVVNLSETVKRAIESLTDFPPLADHQLETSLHDNALVEGDSVLLQRMCTNLIENALKFSPSGTTVSIVTTVEEGVSILSVRDQGIGISDVDQSLIFKRFYQVDSSRAVGSGLGLPLAKWVIETHGGAIRVESTPNKGATFIVELPTAQSS